MKIANPVKAFNYIVEMDGLDVATLQSCDIADIEINKVEHGDGNKDIKTPGKLKIPDIVIEKMLSEDKPDNAFFSWLRDCQDPVTGLSKLPSRVKKTFFVKLLGGDKAPVRIWLVEGAWPTKLKWGKLGDKEDNNFIETGTLSVDTLTVVK